MKNSFLKLIEICFLCGGVTPHDGMRIYYAAMNVHRDRIEHALSNSDKKLPDLVREFMSWQYGVREKPLWLEADLEGIRNGKEEIS